MTSLPGQKTRCCVSQGWLGAVLCLLLLLVLSSLAPSYAAPKGNAARGAGMHHANGVRDAGKAGSQRSNRQERAERSRQERAERRQERAERRQERAERKQERAQHRQERAERRHDRAERRQERAERRNEQAERRKERAERRKERAERRKERAERRKGHSKPSKKALLPNPEPDPPSPAIDPELADNIPAQPTPSRRERSPQQTRHNKPKSEKSELKAAIYAAAKLPVRRKLAAAGLVQPTQAAESGPSSVTVVSLGQEARGEAKQRQAKKPARAIAKEIVLSLKLANAARIEAEIAASYRLAIVERSDLALIGRRIIRARVRDGRPVAAVLAAMRNDSRIVSVQPNYIHLSPGVTETQYSLEKLGIAAAHAIATGAGVTIAVIDTGIDASHPALRAAVISSFDATGENPPLSDPHGTAIAGIIAARGSVEGVAPQAKLLDIRVFAPAADGSGPAATTMSLLRGLQWAADHGARIVNLSLTGGRDELVGQAVEAMLARDIIIVAAAGNNGADAPAAYPAAFDGVIAVTATDAGDALYGAANRGAYITLAAPGVDVIAPTFNAAYAIHSGTSFAAANVSGIIALMLERQPQLSARQIRTALQTKAKDLGPPGTDDQFGAGRINALAVLR